ncbi:HAMP domain-containing methyl-accepting chemotaxis protein [Dokdonella soli]|uniref:Methyl-accepting chemotaxis protein n=1 Tax=Dokdonella soli TaxID=529810 RepID=A0ABN1ISC4_9GAMM
MFKSLSIRTKMYLQIGLMMLALIGLIGAAFFQGRILTDQINGAVRTGTDSTTLVALARSAHVNFQRQVQEWKDVLIRGNDAALFQKYHDQFTARAADVQRELAASKVAIAKAGMSTSVVDKLVDEHAKMLTTYETALKSFDAADPEAGKKVDLQVRGLDRATSTQFDELIQNVVSSTTASLSALEKSGAEATSRSLVAIASAAAIAVLALLLSVVVVRTILRNVKSLSSVVGRLSAGDFAARSNLDTLDELGQLGSQLNKLLDERLSVMLAAQRENDQLNNSVVNIMTSVAQLAQRDLSIRVPVSEDVTGAVSDAINMMTTSTARALADVSGISRQVSDSSTRVKERADAVHSLAGEASNQAGEASKELTDAANALHLMGEQAQSAGRDAERALTTTGDALKIVGQTVEGIASSRDQIRETEKRVKRLAERSQEISATVTIIGQIAERTSVLALNASMQAVAAGDAGRGFAVVADEVKRLAENAREATQQIAGLVNAIQSDTSETLQAMNNTITKVVEITHLADRAGSQMNDTRHATEALVNSVRSISQTTQAQGAASQRLLERARSLLTASKRTLEEIGEQRSDTESLSDSASSLVRTISAFQLPA